MRSTEPGNEDEQRGDDTDDRRIEEHRDEQLLDTAADLGQRGPTLVDFRAGTDVSCEDPSASPTPALLNRSFETVQTANSVPRTIVCAYVVG